MTEPTLHVALYEAERDFLLIACGEVPDGSTRSRPDAGELTGQGVLDLRARLAEAKPAPWPSLKSGETDERTRNALAYDLVREIGRMVHDADDDADHADDFDVEHERLQRLIARSRDIMATPLRQVLSDALRGARHERGTFDQQLSVERLKLWLKENPHGGRKGDPIHPDDIRNVLALSAQPTSPSEAEVSVPGSVKELLEFIEWALENDQPVNSEHVAALSDALRDAYRAHPAFDQPTAGVTIKSGAMIKWAGGENPAGRASVEYWVSGDLEDTRMGFADQLDWSHSPKPPKVPIVAYRVLDDPSPATSASGAVAAAIKALEPVALLVGYGDPDNTTVNLSDPISKWLTIAQLHDAAQALAALTSEPKAEGAFEFPYQRTFNAIADAVTRYPRYIGISVEKFQRSFNASGPAPHPLQGGQVTQDMVDAAVDAWHRHVASELLDTTLRHCIVAALSTAPDARERANRHLRLRLFPHDFAPAYQTVAHGGLTLPDAAGMPEVHPLITRLADPSAFAVNLSATIDEDAEACGICDVVFINGDRCITDITLGPVHYACIGPERESFVNLETGEPIPDDQPLPLGWIWNGDGSISRAGAVA